MDMLFPNKIILKENKRLKTEEDKKRLKELYEDIFDYKQDLIKVLIKHGIIKTELKHIISSQNYDDYTGERMEYDKRVLNAPNRTTDLTTKINVSYFTYKSREINKMIHGNKTKVVINEADESIEYDGTKYWKGLELVCKRSYKSKKQDYTQIICILLLL